MPPASFIAAATPIYDQSTSIAPTVQVPQATRPGDDMLLVVATDGPLESIEGEISTGLENWTVAAVAVSSDDLRQMTILRRVAAEGDPPTFTVSTAGIPSMFAAVLLVYRGTDTSASVVDKGIVHVDVDVTSFPLPGITLSHYSDIAIGLIVLDLDLVSNETPPANATLRYQADHSVLEASVRVAVFDAYPEAVGAIAQTATMDLGPRSGIAASFALAAPAAPVPKFLSQDVPGAIGFVDVGV